MKSAHLRACDIADALDELVRMRPQYHWRDNWTAHVRKLLAELHVALIEADREVGDAFDARRTRWGVQRQPCAWCGGPMPTDIRADATTCSKRCRQAKSRGGSGKRVKFWPKGIRTASSSRATEATDAELGNRRTRRASCSASELDPNDWRSDERRKHRQQLTMTIAPPIGAKEDTRGE